MLLLLSLAALAAAKTPVGVMKRDAPSVTCDNSTIPHQIRLAYAGPNGMAVSWNTNSKLAQPLVVYGTHQNLLTGVASSDISITYPTSSTYNNHVKIFGLKPNTQY